MRAEMPGESHSFPARITGEPTRWGYGSLPEERFRRRLAANPAPPQERDPTRGPPQSYRYDPASMEVGTLVPTADFEHPEREKLTWLSLRSPGGHLRLGSLSHSRMSGSLTHSYREEQDEMGHRHQETASLSDETQDPDIARPYKQCTIWPTQPQHQEDDREVVDRHVCSSATSRTVGGLPVLCHLDSRLIVTSWVV